MSAAAAGGGGTTLAGCARQRVSPDGAHGCIERIVLRADAVPATTQDPESTGSARSFPDPRKLCTLSFGP
jgi:hypothetical protein